MMPAAMRGTEAWKKVSSRRHRNRKPKSQSAAARTSNTSTETHTSKIGFHGSR